MVAATGRAVMHWFRQPGQLDLPNTRTNPDNLKVHFNYTAALDMLTNEGCSMTTRAQASIEDLYGVEEGAEIVNGEVIVMSPSGADPGYAGDEIFASLREFSRQTGTGRAVGDNKAFHVNLPNRSSFSPDAAFHIGPNPRMKFYVGAPIFAVEVRSENDYGAAAEKRIAAKRADYFAAGTLVLWEVDLLSPDVIKSFDYRDPENPRIFRIGDIADAEPALRGWKFAVDDLFAKP